MSTEVFGTTGSLVDDGVPFSAIGRVELEFLRDWFVFLSPGIENKPAKVTMYDSCQYSIGEHTGKAKSIVGSVTIHVRSN